MSDVDRSNAIAIVGMGGRFPDASDLDAFWRNIRGGVESLETFTDADLDAARVDRSLRAAPRYVRRGTVLEGADLFDASFFGFSPREAQALDPQQRIFLETAWEAVEHAGYAGAVAGQSVGVYAGVGMNLYVISHLLANPSFLASVGGYQLMIANDKDFLSTRVSYKLDLRGPSVTVQTACSTSLVAVVMACRALRHGECDMALAGGSAIMLPQRTGYLFEEGMIFSPDGHCRPFDENARGTRGGSGAGAVVLKRLNDAIADRDTIHAVILGGAMNNDGAGKAGFTAPSIEGQVEVIATAQALAGVDPRTIEYIEAHGTATPLGDPIEIAALTQAFRASTSDVGFCRLGSLKANLGHLDAAAGVAGLIKTVMALRNAEFPPLVNFTRANPQLALDASPFVASAERAPWPATTGAPRRAGVSSFGIGGTNAHVVLEEAPPAPATPASRDAHLLILSARSEPALDRMTENLRTYLEAHSDLSLADVEYTLQTGRQVFAHRRAVVVRDRAHAIEVLAAPRRAPSMTETYEGGTRSVAFLFSGQGSQHVDMGAGLYRTERVYRDAVDRCAELLRPHLGVDLRDIVFAAAGDTSLNETRFTQPALFSVEYALASLWMSRGITPAAMLGHSIGEYVAAHLAGVMSLEDALAVVAARGRLMQQLPSGSMAAVGLAGPELDRLLLATPGVEIAAFNAPNLSTVSGPREAIAALGARLGTTGDYRPLHTSHAFHSAMMEPALAPFTEVLRRIVLSPPAIPYVSNLTGTWITDEQATSPDYYANHLRHAVKFEAGVRALAADPALLLLEVGPGNALTSLARLTLGRNAHQRVFSTLAHVKEQRSDTEAMLEATARLWMSGADIDWRGVHADAKPRRIPLPTYPFERKRFWVDPELQTPATAPTVKAPRTVDESLFVPTWSRDDSPSETPNLSGAWLVLAHPGPLASAVSERLTRAGAFVVNIGSDADIASVVRTVRASGKTVAGAVHLLNSDSGDGSDLAHSYHSVMALAFALEPPHGGQAHIVVVTSGAASVLDEPVRFPSRAIVLGPVLSLPREMIGLRLRAVDVDLETGSDAIEAAASAIVDEAASDDNESMVARRAGRRWIRRFEPVSLPQAPAKLPLKRRGVYLITGGTGGIGLAVARTFATHASARLVLTARTPLPERDTWDAWLASHPATDRTSDAIRGIREVERLGGEVLLTVADVSDEAAMRRALAASRTHWGSPIDGVVHAAGISGSGRIAALKEAGEAERVITPKVAGLTVLRTLLGATSLDFVLLISSINSMMPDPGMSDYAAANAILDAFAQSADRPAAWRRVVVINYGPWRDIGMASRRFETGITPARRDAFLQIAVSPDVGTDALLRVLASGRRQIVVFGQDFARLMDALRAKVSDGVAGPNAPVPPAAVGAPEPAGPTVSTTYEAPDDETERRIAGIWSELLGVSRVGVNDNFFELGGHSLLATRVLARVEQSIGARLTLRDVFEAPTVRQLAERLGAASPHHDDSDREELEF